jgi:hypothetical protein
MMVPSRFRRAAENLNKLMVDGTESKRGWANSEKSLDVPATGAQLFDSLTVGRFYNLLIIGMAVRGLRLEISQNPNSELAGVLADLETRFAKWAEELENELDYRVIPIKTLVEIQLGAALEFIAAL